MSAPPTSAPASDGKRRRPPKWVVAAAVVVIVGGAYVWSILPPAVEDLSAKAGVITVRNESFWAATASLDRCTHQGDMPLEAFGLAGVTFTMHRVGCYSPGGGALKGEAKMADGVLWAFSIANMALPDADGNKVRFSPDNEVGVGYFGQNLTLLVHV